MAWTFSLRMRLAGLSGVAAALCWITGDILLLGRPARAQDHPLLLAYADRLNLDLALRMAEVPPGQLMGGALIAAFALPLYMAACWHLWHGLRGAGTRWAVPAVALIFTGYALSPVAHAAFYFLGAVYQSLPQTPASAHPQLLQLSRQFETALVWIYYPSVASSALGLLWFSAGAGTGRSAYPRWFAISAHPLVLSALCIGGPALLRRHFPTVSPMLECAAFNTLWLLFYLQSLVLLWRHPGTRA